jgi:GNAT superfamily N-acetyltransferase
LSVISSGISVDNITGEIAARRATPGDIPSLMDICRAGFSGSLLWDGPRFLSRNWWKSVLASCSVETWVFPVHDEVCGVCVLVTDMEKWLAEPLRSERSRALRWCAAALCPRLVLSRLVKTVLAPRPVPCAFPRSEAAAPATAHRTWIRLLAVAPDKRRLGMGRKILQLCEDRTLALGRQVIGLSVFKDNIAAQRLYAQQGYVCTNYEHDRYVFTKLLAPVPTEDHRIVS